MKKSFLIAGGVIIIIILVVLWIYLLFYGTPKNVDDVFTNFNFFDEEETLAEPLQIPLPPEVPVVNVIGKDLRQLTTRPVIGFREVRETPTSTPYMYYAEAGTGHVYSINLTSGEEKRISGTTVTDASRADFSDDGQYIVIQSGAGRAQKTSLGGLKQTSDSVSLTTLSDAIDVFTITQSGELLYTVQNAVTTGKAMNLATRVVRTIFTLPFRDATIVWGKSGSDTHYTYPKTSYQLESFVYAIKSGALTRLPLAGYGLLTTGSQGILAVSTNENQVPVPVFYNTATKESYSAPFTMFPEKCVFSSLTKGTLWCASFVGMVGDNFPDNWYTGENSSRDILFEINFTPDALSTTNLVNTFTETGRDLDATHMSIGKSEENLYFINKNDNALWMYDLGN